MEKGNADAYYILAGYYAGGEMGLPQDWLKANELYLKAGELGCAGAYFNLGNSYDNGRGVEIDEKKAEHYYELAAMNGSVHARHNLGCMEFQAGNHQRAYQHFLIGAKAGCEESLAEVKKGYTKGIVSKDKHAEEIPQTAREYEE